MPYRSHLPAVRDRLRLAADAGLTASGVLYANAVKRALTGGYTTGAFVTGRVRNSVAVTSPEPAPSGGGGRQVRVGSNLLYALYWEVGHQNLFTRHFERVEKWRPTLVDHRDAIRGEFARVFALVMRAGQNATAPAPSSEAAD